MTSDTNVQMAVPLFSVRDIEKSRAFYVETLGGTMTREWRPNGQLRWCWIQLGDAAVMLQTFAPKDHRNDVDDRPLGVGVNINFICRDAVKLYRELEARGVRARRPVVGNRMWVTQLEDPDGYRLFFESETQDAEGSVLDARESVRAE